MIWGWLAYRLVIQSINEYKQEGYEVQYAPDDSGADFIAKRDGETVAVQIKVRAAGGYQMVSSPSDFPDLRGMRLDVVWQPVLQLARPDEITRRTDEVRVLAEGHSEAAFLLAYAALEAAVLRVASTLPEAPKPPFEARYVMPQLRDQGLISDEELAAIVRASRLRNALIHGVFSDERVDSYDAESVANIATALATSASSLAVELLDRVLQRRVILDNSPQTIEWFERQLREQFPDASTDVLSRAVDILRQLDA